MEGVGPGSVLAGRYTVGALVRQSAGAQRWTAREPVLGRSVSLLILPSGDSRAAAVLDAARMAAGLDIPGCVRILDIGQEGPAAWVVEEALADAKSVVDLVRNGGLPGDEVRRIVGEAATSSMPLPRGGCTTCGSRPRRSSALPRATSRCVVWPPRRPCTGRRRTPSRPIEPMPSVSSLSRMPR